MIKLLRIGGLLSVAFAVLVYPAIAGIAATAVEVYLVPAKDPSLVEQEKILFDPEGMKKDSPEYRKAVISIYGLPTEETTSVVFVSDAQLTRPPELPGILILAVDKHKGENPMQTKTLWFFAKYLAGGSAFAGALLLGLSAWLGRRKPGAAAPAA
jgi:hypothetical protein